MSTHTPGPWQIFHGEEIHGITDQSGRHIAEMWNRPNALGWDAIANARRIVACVNACEGLPTEHLEGIQKEKADYWARIASERTELLAALKAFEAIEDETRKVWESSGIMLEEDFAQKAANAWALLHFAISRIEAGI